MMATTELYVLDDYSAFRRVDFFDRSNSSVAAPIPVASILPEVERKLVLLSGGKWSKDEGERIMDE